MFVFLASTAPCIEENILSADRDYRKGLEVVIDDQIVTEQVAENGDGTLWFYFDLLHPLIILLQEWHLGIMN